MSLIQGIVNQLLPRSWSRSIEEESRLWVAMCECGRETSVWEMGGVRYGAVGKPWRLCTCSSCGEVAWRQLYKKQALPEVADLESEVKPAGTPPPRSSSG